MFYKYILPDELVLILTADLIMVYLLKTKNITTLESYYLVLVPCTPHPISYC